MLARIASSWKATIMIVVLVAAAAGLASFVAAAGDREQPAQRSASELAAERAGQTTPNQAAILADGLVTREEYESAVYATIACLAADGFVVDGPVDNGDGRLHFTFSTADRDEGARYQAAYQRCHEQNQRDVDLVWTATLAEQHPTPSADLLALSRAAIAECLAGRGVPGVPADAPLLEMIDRAEAAGKPKDLFYQCAGVAQEEYGVLPNE